MDYGIKLTIDGKEVNVLHFSMEYFHPNPMDPVLMPPNVLDMAQKIGTVSPDFKPPIFISMDDCNRNLPFYRFKPRGEPLDGRLHVTIESTDDDNLFYEGLKTGKFMHGVFRFYRAEDEEIPFRTIEFWDAFVSETREQMSSGDAPMLLHFVLSPATVRFNKELVFQKNWYITEIDEKPVEVYQREEEEEKTLVREVKGEKEALPNQKVKYKVTRYNKSNVSDFDRKNVRWAVKADGKQEDLKEKGESIELKMKDEWVTKEITVMAYLESPDEKVSQKTKVTDCQYKDVKIVANYIVAEMLTNMDSEICQKIKKYNHDALKVSPLDKLAMSKVVVNKMMAYKLWKNMVGAGCKWDHKGHIKDEYEEWTCNKKGKISLKFNFDIWSNIHYGFVGKHIGFSEMELLNGAGYAQIGDNNKSLSSWDTWKEYLKNRTVDFGDADFLGGFDDPKDQQAIKVGFALYDAYKRNLTADLLISKLIEKYNSGKPINVEKCEQH